MRYKIADDSIYGPIRLEIGRAYIRAGKPDSTNWLYTQLVRSKKELQEIKESLNIAKERKQMGDSKFKLGMLSHNKKIGDNAKKTLFIGPVDLGQDVIGPCLFKHGTNPEASIIPEDEPLFIMRGKDALSVEVLRAYLSLASFKCEPHFLTQICFEIGRFETWQKENQDKVKLPD